MVLAMALAAVCLATVEDARAGTDAAAVRCGSTSFGGVPWKVEGYGCNAADREALTQLETWLERLVQTDTMVADLLLRGRLPNPRYQRRDTSLPTGRTAMCIFGNGSSPFDCAVWTPDQRNGWGFSFHLGSSVGSSWKPLPVTKPAGGPADKRDCGKVALAGETWEYGSITISCSRARQIGTLITGVRASAFAAVKPGGAVQRLPLPGQTSGTRWTCTLFYGDAGTARTTTNSWWCMDLAHPSAPDKTDKTAFIGSFPTASFLLVPKAAAPARTTGPTIVKTK